jgi:hypothetical protein
MPSSSSSSNSNSNNKPKDGRPFNSIWRISTARVIPANHVIRGDLASLIRHANTCRNRQTLDSNVYILIESESHSTVRIPSVQLRRLVSRKVLNSHSTTTATPRSSLLSLHLELLLIPSPYSVATRHSPSNKRRSSDRLSRRRTLQGLLRDPIIPIISTTISMSISRDRSITHNPANTGNSHRISDLWRLNTHMQACKACRLQLGSMHRVIQPMVTVV